MTYTVVLFREEDGGFVVSVPALVGCHTQGDTVEEALANAREAITAFVESLRAHGEPVPVDGGPPSFEMEDATEALVYRVALQEAAPVA